MQRTTHQTDTIHVLHADGACSVFDNVNADTTVFDLREHIATTNGTPVSHVQVFVNGAKPHDTAYVHDTTADQWFAVCGTPPSADLWTEPLMSSTEAVPKADFNDIWVCNEMTFHAVHNVVNVPPTLNESKQSVYLVGIYGCNAGVHAMNLINGQTEWFYALDVGKGTAPVELAHDGTVALVCSASKTTPSVHAIDTTTGANLWQQALPSPVCEDVPLHIVEDVAGTTLCIVQTDYHCLAMDVNTGVVRWTCNTIARAVCHEHKTCIICCAPFDHVAGSTRLELSRVAYETGVATPLYTEPPFVKALYEVAFALNNTVMVVYTHSTIYAYDVPATNERFAARPRWQLPISNSMMGTTRQVFQKGDNLVALVVALNETRVLAVCNNEGCCDICCFEVDSGRLCWKHPHIGRQRLFTTDTHVYNATNTVDYDASDILRARGCHTIDIATGQVQLFHRLDYDDVHQMFLHPEHDLAIVQSSCAQMYKTMHLHAFRLSGERLWSREMKQTHHDACTLTADGTALVTAGWNNRVRLIRC